VAGETLLERAMAHCAAAGIQRFFVNTHLHPEAFTRHFPGGSWRGLPVEWVHEPYRLETGGGLRNLHGRFGPEPLLVYNPDIVTDAPLEKLFAAHAAGGGERLVTLGTLPGGPEPHVLADSRGTVRALGPEALSASTAPEDRASTFLGLSVVEPAFLAYLRPGVRESVVAGWRRALADSPGSVALCALTPCRWADAGTPAAYGQLRADGLEAAPAWPEAPA
jgi:NDP-sugar pyrophosphorylase family protein